MVVAAVVMVVVIACRPRDLSCTSFQHCLKCSSWHGEEGVGWEVVLTGLTLQVAVVQWKQPQPCAQFLIFKELHHFFKNFSLT